MSRLLAVVEFLTLDGVMQSPGHPEEDSSGEFKHGGWSNNFWPEVMPQVNEHAMAEPIDLLFGRNTYDSFAGFWPEPSPQVPTDVRAHAKVLNQSAKFVVTSRPGLEWPISTGVDSNDVAGAVAKLKAQNGPLIQVHGSWQLVQTLISEGLVDEFRLWTFPVVVGSGKRLFEQSAPPAKLSVVKSEATTTGCTMTFYRPAA